MPTDGWAWSFLSNLQNNPHPSPPPTPTPPPLTINNETLNINNTPQSGTDFYDVYTGVGARRIRETFDMMRNFAPAILFVDEVGTSRRESEKTRIEPKRAATRLVFSKTFPALVHVTLLTYALHSITFAITV